MVLISCQQERGPAVLHFDSNKTSNMSSDQTFKMDCQNRVKPFQPLPLVVLSHTGVVKVLRHSDE